MPQFHETPMGRKFFEGTMPRIADALEKLVAILDSVTVPRTVTFNSTEGGEEE